MAATEQAWIPAPVVRMEVDAMPAERFAAVPGELVAASRTLLAAIEREFLDMGGASTRATITQMLTSQLLPRLPRYQQLELQAIAAQLETPIGDVLLANVSYDLLLAQFGCSTVALPTSDGPVVARNMDWWPTPELARASVSLGLVEADSKALRTENFGWFGVVGLVSGYSARGRFAVVINAVQCGERANLTGQPVLLFLRHVVETAANFDEACRLLRTTALVTGGIFTVVGETDEQRAIIERSTTRAAVRTPEGPEAPLFATNDYRALGVRARQVRTDAHNLYGTACTRFERLEEIVREEPEAFGAGGKAPVSDEALLTMLTDPEVFQPITAQHVIARPAIGQAAMWLPAQYL